MKKILMSALVVGAVAGVINALLAFLLGGSMLETPFEPGTTTHTPVGQFAMASGIMTLILTLIGSLLLALLTRKSAASGVRLWTIIGVVFLVLYGIFPFAAPGMASFKAGILTNLLHAVAGFAALYFIPRRANLV